MHKKSKSFEGFTLVELIIVIIILIILSTIAFLSFGGYAKNTRDSNRVTTIANLDKGLTIYAENSGKYPHPEGTVNSGSINNIVLTYVGNVGENISRVTKFNQIPNDPLTNSNYSYGVSSDYKNYQIASFLEGELGQSLIIKNVYADGERAKVIGNYNGYLLYKTGSETWIANIPSLIFNNTGSVDLISTGIYYVVNNKNNLPYNIKGSKDSNIQKIDSSQLIKEITKSTSATLTGVNITEVLNNTKVISEIFTGAILESFNIIGEEITNTGIILSHISEVLAPKGSQPESSSGPAQCFATSYKGLSLTTMSNGETHTLSGEIENGNLNVNVKCNNGNFEYTNEVINCNENHYVSGGLCVQTLAVKPTNLTLTHTPGYRNFTLAWSGGTSNGYCRIQYLKNGTTWTNVNEGNYFCDSDSVESNINLPIDDFNGSWSSIQIRLFSINENLSVGVFPQTLTCTSTTGSLLKKTPNIDEDCNGEWDNFVTGSITSTKTQNESCTEDYSKRIDNISDTQCINHCIANGYSQCWRLDPNDPQWGSFGQSCRVCTGDIHDSYFSNDYGIRIGDKTYY